MDNYGGGPSRSSQVYVGYPYVNPTIQDVPTISAEVAAKWNNLPRRPAPGSVKSGSQAGSSDGQSNQRVQPDRPQMVFIDVPENSGSIVSERRQERREQAVEHSRHQQQASSALSPKLDPDENPVVYIDLPENSGSEVADRREVENDQTYVQDTIFYDPFKNQRVIGHGSISSASSSGSGTGVRQALQTRPNPPNTLNLASSSSGFPGPSSGLPPSMSKQTDVYGQFGLPTEYQRGDFPEPPPAYTEIDSTPGSMAPSIPATPSTPAPTEPPQIERLPEPPRTQVLISSDALNPDSLTTLCHGCSVTSTCIMLTENGTLTHIAAIIFLLTGIWPLIILVYCTSWFKNKNYYCRNCNKLVAYEIPVTCQGKVYVK